MSNSHPPTDWRLSLVRKISSAMEKEASPPTLTALRKARSWTDVRPTPAQQDAGNYRKGKVGFHGLTISIENPKGSVRSGVSPDGKAWSSVMKQDYGYVLRTEARDGDQLDVFIGPNLRSEIVFVINQTDPRTNRFDEHKVMLGFDNQRDAARAYLSNYERGWRGLGSACPLTVAQFKKWARDGDLTRPLSPTVRVVGAALRIQPPSKFEKSAAHTAVWRILFIDKYGEQPSERHVGTASLAARSGRLASS